MQRLLGLTLGVYAPHLLEEHLTGMWNDTLIVSAFEPIGHLPARQSAYLVFQVMLALALVITYSFSRGGRWRTAVMASLGFALLCESHHVIRALAAHSYNSGLVTSLPMPILGAWILYTIARRRERNSSHDRVSESSQR